MGLSDLQNVFNMILDGEVVSLLFATKKQYDSCRVNLLRKFKNHKKIFDDLGADSPYADKYIQCTFDKDAVRGRFQLAEETQRKNVPNVTRFQIEQL